MLLEKHNILINKLIETKTYIIINNYIFDPKNCAFKVIINPPTHCMKKTKMKTTPLLSLSL